MRLPSLRLSAGTAQGIRASFLRRLSPNSASSMEETPNLTAQASSVNTNPRDVGIDEDVHYCSLCDQCFASAGALLNHNDYNHWHEVPNDETSNTSLRGGQTHSYADNPFPRCTLCGQFFGTEENLSDHLDVMHRAMINQDRERDLPPLPSDDEFSAEESGSASVQIGGRISPIPSLASVERRFPALPVEELQTVDTSQLIVRSQDKWCPTCNLRCASSAEFSKHCKETGHQSRLLVSKNRKLVLNFSRSSDIKTSLENVFPRPLTSRTCSLDYAGTDSETDGSAKSARDVVDAGTDSLLHHCRVCDNYFTSLGDLHFHRWSQACIPSVMNRPETEHPSEEPLRDVAVEKKSAYECPLCMEEEYDLSTLACGHIFGTECARTALQRDRRCPLCRQPSVIGDLRRIFMS
ncbi:hypothetical protein SCHPADRAFT_392725 [Schizopora paradoxa]|uniref:RING-type domain-containing protein n=1 Tax=Schizopora paradoxa TaxID=27342 RepID=A0A0H2RMZ7_9AGAM|nr:hypothetical protein SCHPADRAFT_392725 [Schizopora paradoxa]